MTAPVFNIRERADSAKSLYCLETLASTLRARAADIRHIVRWPALADSLDADVAYIESRLALMREQQA